MLYLVRDRENTIWIEPNSAINISGFQATLAVCGTIKTITDLTVRNPKMVFTVAESNRCEDGVFGELRVTDTNGKLHFKYLPQFASVESKDAHKAVGNQKLVITISTNYNDHESGSAGGSGGSSDSAVTEAQVYQIVNSAVTNKVDNILTTQQVTTTDSSGNPVSMTVQEMAQQTVVLQEKVEEAAETHLQGGIKDEDNDGQPDDGILYLNTEVNK